MKGGASCVLGPDLPNPGVHSMPPLHYYRCLVFLVATSLWELQGLPLALPL